MLWVLFALGVTVSVVIRDLYSKSYLDKGVNEYVMAFFGRLYALPALLFILIFFGEIPGSLNVDFYFALFISSFLLVISSILYTKALKYSKPSHVIPLLGFTPVFLLILSPLVLLEVPSFLGVIGVVLIVFGSYFLNISKSKESFFAPFKSLYDDVGSRYMLLVSFLFAVGGVFSKQGVLNSSPIFWLFSLSLFVTIGLFPILFVKIKTGVRDGFVNFKPFLIISLVSSLGLLSQMIAFTMTNVAYVIAIKRTSAVMLILVSIFFLREKDLKSKLLGASIMVVGVLVIVLFG